MPASISLLEHVLDQFKGTPEEFGELLEVATGPTWLATPDAFSAKYSARARIRKLDRGAELLKAEDWV